MGGPGLRPGQEDARVEGAGVAEREGGTRERGHETRDHGQHDNPEQHDRPRARCGLCRFAVDAS